MKKHYITAVLEMLQTTQDVEAVISGLRKTLEAKGHMKLFAPVLRGVYLILDADRISTKAEVFVANKSSLEEQKEEIAAALQELAANGDYETVIDESIIGGHIVSYNNTLLDRSYKTALTKLYRSITN